jgi:hypothetical protein
MIYFTATRGASCRRASAEYAAVKERGCASPGGHFRAPGFVAARPGVLAERLVQLGEQHFRALYRAMCRHVTRPRVGCLQAKHMPDAQGYLLVRGRMRGAQRCLEIIDRPLRRVLADQWRVWEEAVLARLALTRGPAAAPLLPGSDVIYLVTYDGEHLGHVRREGPRARSECWVAVPLMEMPMAGYHPSAEAAARALARACGRA